MKFVNWFLSLVVLGMSVLPAGATRVDPNTSGVLTIYPDHTTGTTNLVTLFTGYENDGYSASLLSFPILNVPDDSVILNLYRFDLGNGDYRLWAQEGFPEANDDTYWHTTKYWYFPINGPEGWVAFDTSFAYTLGKAMGWDYIAFGFGAVFPSPIGNIAGPLYSPANLTPYLTVVPEPSALLLLSSLFGLALAAKRAL